MKAYELLEKPESWTQGVYARDVACNSISSLSEYACCWCVGGALKRVYPEYNERKLKHFRLLNALGVSLVSVWNDSPTTTHADVVKLLRELDI